jgi:hypothetical protein
MSKAILPLFYVAAFSALAYYAYRSIKSALQPPEVTKRRMSYGEDEDGQPIYDDDCDIDATIALWKEQSRIIRSSMGCRA